MNKIMVLSTDSSLRQKYVKELVKSGFHVADASDFLDGILRATKTKFDVVIIDEEIYSKGNRLEFTKIRNYSDAHLILLGKNAVNDISTEDNGFDAYFQRSANPQELVAYIKGIIIAEPDIKREIMLPKDQAATAASSQSESIVTIITDLEQQIAKIKTVMAGISQLQSQISDAENVVRQQQQAFETVLRKLAEVNKYLESLAGNQ